MRLTFIHDHKFYYENGNYYSSGKFSKDIMSKYFISPIDSIQFIGRVNYKKDNLNHLSLATSDNITINPIKFLKKKSDFLIKKKKIQKFLEKNIDSKDIVIIRLPSEIGYAAAEFLKNRNIPYGIELVGDPWDALWYHGSLVGKVMAFINKAKVKKYVKEANHTIYVTKEYLQARYPSKNKTYNASNVFISKINDSYSNNDLTPRRIGLIGSLDTKYKGIETAFKSLSLIDSDVKMEIVGNGPQEFWNKKIKKYKLQEKVTLKGTLKAGDEINEWLSTLDLYIQPSYTEGLPRALIEAMSNGIPCLGSSAGGIPELLQEDYIHPVKNYKILAKQIEEVMSNKTLRDKMSKENLITASDYLSINIQKEREEFIKSICEEKSYES